ncbi:MAG: hypothetical protein JNM07_00455 [Phycisphaerae bacterium]|nr:hypothetical protein [Phycisphaerae bacterium]
MRTRLASRLVWLIGAAPLVGCIGITPAASDRGAIVPVAADAWPTRKTDGLYLIAAYLRDFDATQRTFSRTGSVTPGGETDGADRATAVPRGMGIVRDGGVRADCRGVVRDLEFLSFPSRSAGQLGDAAEPTPAVRPPSRLELRIPRGVPARGLVVYAAAPRATGTDSDPDRVLIDALTERGWAVLRNAELPSHAPGGLIEVEGDAQLPAAAARLANQTDEILAESAFAFEAVIEHLAACDPAMPISPRVAIGTGIGALVLPAIVARAPAAYDALVLVGGGANIADIGARSELRGPAVFARLSVKGKRSESGPLVRLATLYLEMSRLDPYHLATALRGIPTLFVTLWSDLAVPDDAGQVLWERLGRPERWRLGSRGDSAVRAVPSITDRLALWIDRHAPAASRAPASMP